ncbi:maleylacetoacetate isomerase, partial [Salmonella enterica subsp. enterica serovar Heidelberg]|nr:maleylacetoacetate isomerase [Salmonella enterica subsp. enterica serovar Heidelberg]
PINNMRVLRYLTDELKVREEDKKRWYAHWIQQGLSAVEQLLRKSQSGRFCVGDAPGLADCCLIPQWANALRMGCDLSGYPRCKAVYDACVQLPAFIAAAPENQQDKIPA